jgi:hypothetical protein
VQGGVLVQIAYRGVRLAVEKVDRTFLIYDVEGVRCAVGSCADYNASIPNRPAHGLADRIQ